MGPKDIFQTVDEHLGRQPGGEVYVYAQFCSQVKVIGMVDMQYRSGLISTSEELVLRGFGPERR